MSVNLADEAFVRRQRHAEAARRRFAHQPPPQLLPQEEIDEIVAPNEIDAAPPALNTSEEWTSGDTDDEADEELKKALKLSRRIAKKDHEEDLMFERALKLSLEEHDAEVAGPSTSSFNRSSPKPSPCNDLTKTCQICYESYNAHAHRLCCLPCGHVFGHECRQLAVEEETMSSVQSRCPGRHAHHDTLLRFVRFGSVSSCFICSFIHSKISIIHANTFTFSRIKPLWVQ